MPDPSAGPHPVDVHVGLRLRLRRKALGFSQEQLAEAIGLTFQQIQKYKRGANRISASKLYEFCRILEAPVSYFFNGLALHEPGKADAYAYRSITEALLAEPDGMRMARAFLEIHRRDLKRRLADLAHALVQAQSADDDRDGREAAE